MGFRCTTGSNEHLRESRRGLQNVATTGSGASSSLDVSGKSAEGSKRSPGCKTPTAATMVLPRPTRPPL
eukprot:CAMPEP_0195158234 /NCGR_PEP_ID=MMETSP0448-20130528/185562_1 /TAXON_ID=66468 /ORGANISM="Heterocapsa triquestra, Strain CCMP 448" /LENGTH=68 /DNA_ID=CAMNT_0040197031 /DNA_START=731 /DNA_END=937 /DNA_ORIENTATION=-